MMIIGSAIARHSDVVSPPGLVIARSGRHRALDRPGEGHGKQASRVPPRDCLRRREKYRVTPGQRDQLQIAFELHQTLRECIDPAHARATRHHQQRWLAGIQPKFGRAGGARGSLGKLRHDRDAGDKCLPGRDATRDDPGCDLVAGDKIARDVRMNPQAVHIEVGHLDEHRRRRMFLVDMRREQLRREEVRAHDGVGRPAADLAIEPTRVESLETAPNSADRGVGRCPHLAKAGRHQVHDVQVRDFQLGEASLAGGSAEGLRRAHMAGARGYAEDEDSFGSHGSKVDSVFRLVSHESKQSTVGKR
jgi:hypothetical protein